MMAKHEKEEMELTEYVVEIHSSLISCVYKKKVILCLIVYQKHFR